MDDQTLKSLFSGQDIFNMWACEVAVYYEVSVH